MYVVGLYIGDWMHYGPFEAWMMFQYNAWGYGGLALALALTDPRVSWRRAGGTVVVLACVVLGLILGALARLRAAMWACWHWLFVAILAGPDCPKCNSYRTVPVHKSYHQCTCCGNYFTS